MAKFAVGEVLILQNVTFDKHMQYKGEECTVMALPGHWPSNPDHYKIAIRNADANSPNAALERYLRRKDEPPSDKYEPSRGDMDTLVKWEDMPWQPKELTTVKDY